MLSLLIWWLSIKIGVRKPGCSSVLWVIPSLLYLGTFPPLYSTTCALHCFVCVFILTPSFPRNEGASRCFRFIWAKPFLGRNPICFSGDKTSLERWWVARGGVTTRWQFWDRWEAVNLSSNHGCLPWTCVLIFRPGNIFRMPLLE